MSDKQNEILDEKQRKLIESFERNNIDTNYLEIFGPDIIVEDDILYIPTKDENRLGDHINKLIKKLKEQKDVINQKNQNLKMLTVTINSRNNEVNCKDERKLFYIFNDIKNESDLLQQNLEALVKRQEDQIQYEEKIRKNLEENRKIFIENNEKLQLNKNLSLDLEKNINELKNIYSKKENYINKCVENLHNLKKQN